MGNRISTLRTPESEWRLCLEADAMPSDATFLDLMINFSVSGASVASSEANDRGALESGFETHPSKNRRKPGVGTLTWSLGEPGSVTRAEL